MISQHLESSSRKNPFLLLVVLLALLAAALPCAFAADDDAKISVELFVFSIDRNPIDGLYYTAPNGEKTLLQFASRRRSGPYPYEGPREINFYNRSNDADTGKTQYTPVASATIDQARGEVLVFFLSNNANGNNGQNSLRTLVMDDRPSSFPNGHLRVLNASGASLEGLVGSERVSLGFEVSDPSPLSRIQQGRQNWVEIAFVIRFPDAYELVYANQITFSATNRSIIVLRPPRRPNSIQINTYLIEDSISADRNDGA
jgi:hypothetical protein